MMIVSNRSERDTSGPGLPAVSNSRRFWGWIEDEFGNIIDIGCPYCDIAIHHRETGRMICPKCGRSVGDHGKPPIDPEIPLDRNRIFDFKFFRENKNVSRIQGGQDGCEHQEVASRQSSSKVTPGFRREARATSRY